MTFFNFLSMIQFKEVLEPDMSDNLCLHLGADVAAVAVLPGMTILVGVTLVVDVVATDPGFGASVRRVVGCIWIAVFGNWTLTSWFPTVTAVVTDNKNILLLSLKISFH